VLRRRMQCALQQGPHALSPMSSVRYYPSSDSASSASGEASPVYAPPGARGPALWPPPRMPSGASCGIPPPSPLRDRQLTAAISGCRTAEALRQIVMHASRRLNGIHVCAATSRLAALAARQPRRGPARRLACATVDELGDRLGAMLPFLQPREVSTILYSWWACRGVRGLSAWGR
jgi:hypothetical protein